MRLKSLFAIFGILPALATSTSVLAADPNWPTSLTLGTASPGGVYYVYGEAVAKILTEKLGISVNPLPTQGPVHNVKLIESGGAQLGLVTMGVALQAWKGMADWAKPFQTMRALFPMYDTSFQFTVLGRSPLQRQQPSRPPTPIGQSLSPWGRLRQAAYITCMAKQLRKF